MKMSEMFGLPLSGATLTHIFPGGSCTDFDFCEQKDGKDGQYRVQPTVEKGQAICLAVNSFDEQRATIRELLEGLKPFAGGFSNLHTRKIKDPKDDTKDGFIAVVEEATITLTDLATAHALYEKHKKYLEDTPTPDTQEKVKR